MFIAETPLCIFVRPFVRIQTEHCGLMRENTKKKICIFALFVLIIEDGHDNINLKFFDYTIRKTYQEVLYDRPSN